MISKYILLLTYNRDIKTNEVLSHLKNTANIENYELVVIRQVGNEKVKSLIDSIDWIKVHHIPTTKKESIKQSINYNMHLGLQYCFNSLFAKHVIILEDDIVIGFDFLLFCENIINKYYFNNQFRAINGFSSEKFDNTEIANYARFRYGVGWGWCLTDRVWKNLQLIWNGEENTHFDALIEPFMKAGFVIMPKCSRTLNIGWGNDNSHSPQMEDDEIYVKLKNSWVGSNPIPTIEYIEQTNIKFTWRNDCLPYTDNSICNKISNLFYFHFKSILIYFKYYKNFLKRNI
jgi:hypothetical protein